MHDLTFETEDSSRGNSKFKHGDVVKTYKEDNKIDYPCIILTCENLQKFRIMAMRGLLSHNSLLLQEGMYSVYVDYQGTLTKVGIISNEKLRSLLTNKVFDVFDKKVYLDASTVVSGDMLFALCAATNM